MRLKNFFHRVALCAPILILCGPTRADDSGSVQCDGNPHWCLVVSNEADDGMWVYFDGSPKTRAPGGETIRIPVQAGESHYINYCYQVVTNPGRGLLEIGKQTEKRCSDPQQRRFDSNIPLILYPGK